jgi:hypothetical protein
MTEPQEEPTHVLVWNGTVLETGSGPGPASRLQDEEDGGGEDPADCDETRRARRRAAPRD